MKLFYVPKTRSNRPRWLLEELSVPYELVVLDATKGDTKTAEHLARHPLGHVPVLDAGDGPLFESAAIALHLADRFGLIPAAGTFERALVYQWAFLAMTELEPHAAVYFSEKVRKKTPQSERALEAREKVNEAAHVLDRHLATREFMVADTFTVADVIVGSVAWWANRMGAVDDAPNLVRYIERVTARPAYQRATKD